MFSYCPGGWAYQLRYVEMWIMENYFLGPLADSGHEAFRICVPSGNMAESCPFQWESSLYIGG